VSVCCARKQRDPKRGVHTPNRSPAARGRGSAGRRVAGRALLGSGDGQNGREGDQGDLHRAWGREEVGNEHKSNAGRRQRQGRKKSRTNASVFFETVGFPVHRPIARFQQRTRDRLRRPAPRAHKGDEHVMPPSLELLARVGVCGVRGWSRAIGRRRKHHDKQILT
jgi:hypothetical protein